MQRLVWLDLSGVQQRYDRAQGATLNHHVLSNMGLEYRRFLLLRMMHPELDIPAPPLIDIYWRLHAADRAVFDADCAGLASVGAISADRLVPPAEPVDGRAYPTLRELYASIFPYGNADLWGQPILTPGHRDSAPNLGAVHRRLPDAIDDRTRERLLTEARQRRTISTEWHSNDYRTTRRGTVSSPKRSCSANP